MSNVPNQVVLGYDPNSFFYETVQDKLKPTDTTCNTFKGTDGKYSISWDTKCDKEHIIDNSLNCMQLELCKNKDYSQNINHVLSVHSEAEEKLNNSKANYNTELRRTINLSLGIICALSFIYLAGKQGPPANSAVSPS